MAKKSKVADKPYSAMTPQELREATKEFDDPDYRPRALPWTAEDHRLHRQSANLARALRPGRPRIGLGAERVQVALERDLKSQIDAFARKRGMTRSRLLAEAARFYMSQVA